LIWAAQEIIIYCRDASQVEEDEEEEVLPVFARTRMSEGEEGVVGRYGGRHACKGCRKGEGEREQEGKREGGEGGGERGTRGEGKEMQTLGVFAS